MSSQSISNRPTLAACTNSSIASASDRSTRPPYWIGGGVHGGGSHPGSSHFRGGFVGVYAPYWGVTAFPTTITAITATTAITGITATILAPAITATIPIMATARAPTPGGPGTIAPTPPAIIPM